MSSPLVVSIPHRLGKQEAARRLKNGLSRVGQEFGHIISVEDEIWKEDEVAFRVRALGQTAGGTIQVLEDRLRLEVTLPWLLAKLSERLVPAIQRNGTLLLEKK